MSKLVLPKIVVLVDTFMTVPYTYPLVILAVTGTLYII